MKFPRWAIPVVATFAATGLVLSACGQERPGRSRTPQRSRHRRTGRRRARARGRADDAGGRERLQARQGRHRRGRQDAVPVRQRHRAPARVHLRGRVRQRRRLRRLARGDRGPGRRAVARRQGEAAGRFMAGHARWMAAVPVRQGPEPRRREGAGRRRHLVRGGTDGQEGRPGQAVEPPEGLDGHHGEAGPETRPDLDRRRWPDALPLRQGHQQATHDQLLRQVQERSRLPSSRAGRRSNSKASARRSSTSSSARTTASAS